jgi:hypothetical protein
MKALFFTLFYLGIFLNASAQSELAQRMAQSLDSFKTANPQEKIFLHTDRDYYTANESIWFKAYVTLDEKLSYLSQIVYVFLVDEKGSIVQKVMLPLKNGVANGDFNLPYNLPLGNYSLQATTLWMMNYKNFIYKKPIFIYSLAPVKPAKKRLLEDEKLNIAFFAEGGNFIQGLQNNIAYKITGNNGLPINTSLVIVDSKNNEVTNTSPLHNGIGTFAINPDENEQYTAIVFKGTKAEKKFELPNPQKQGVVLLVNNKNEKKLFAQVEVGNTNKDVYNECILIAQMNNEVVYSAKLNTTNGTATAIINKAGLPKGILQLTLFNTNTQPIAERLVFINNNTSNINEIKIDGILKTPKKDNDFLFKLDSAVHPNLSISIINLNVNPENNETIISNQLLTSNFAEYVHEPSWYFKNNNAETLNALDALLTTQSWKRFDWNKILKNEFPLVKYIFENGLTISGVVTKPQSKTAIAHAKVDFITQTEDSLKIISKVDADKNGFFVLKDLDFKKSATVYFQSTNLDKQKALTEIKLNPDFIDTISYLAAPSIDLNPENFINYVQPYSPLISVTEKTLKDKTLLEGVTVKAKAKSIEEKLTDEYTSAIFAMSDQTVVPDNAAYVDIWQFLRAQVNGMTLERTNGIMTAFFNRNANLFIDPSSTEITENIQFFLNEIPITTDLLESVNINDIALVKVFKGATSYLLGSPNGAIAMYTIKGKSTKDWREKGFDFFKKVGYSISRNFLAPNYNTIKPPYDFNDIRPTLQWIPHFKVNKEGLTKNTFFTDETTKKVKIIVQGIDANGKLIYAEKIWE